MVCRLQLSTMLCNPTYMCEHVLQREREGGRGKVGREGGRLEQEGRQEDRQAEKGGRTRG